MNRSLIVSIDQDTWPRVPNLPLFPPSFHNGSLTFDVNFLGVLLLTGFLTTPPHSPGVSLSEYWAWVRYLHAVTPDSDLRVTSEFASLDAHQKMILSDDFGIGISMYWLAQQLQLVGACDGRYFIERVAASQGATSVKTAKRGPNKSPDYVARDISGAWHVIECKGTQGSLAYRDRQLYCAVSQKMTIDFPAGNGGQRLAPWNCDSHREFV